MRGDKLGPLHGVPIAVKDLVPTEGIRTTWGSLIFKDHVPDTDAVVVARLKQAGAIIVGKTTTPEFGQQCLTEAPLFGRTRNAWRGDRTSGGSSGGSAVAVAAGLVPLAVATDGGGSTRIPAACNGVVGFKQGLGVVPQEYAQDGFRQYFLRYADDADGRGYRVDAERHVRAGPRAIRLSTGRAVGFHRRRFA
jgi:aspartyl-tRNA(Asn)/glutamyl-tRNA(Gln) amidotransferase subunit A